MKRFRSPSMNGLFLLVVVVALTTLLPSSFGQATFLCFKVFCEGENFLEPVTETPSLFMPLHRTQVHRETFITTSKKLVFFAQSVGDNEY